MIMTYDFGHGTGQDRGASGYLNEETVIRQYGPIVVAKLTKLGHTLYDCTPPASPALTLPQSLAYRVNKANSIGSQLHICMHVNAYETDKATGCEVEYASDSGKAYADRIYPEIINALGVPKHGEGSVHRPDLYVLKYTKMTAILVEPFFCDTKADCDKYNAEKLATAIVKGITGIDTSIQTTQTIVATTPIQTAPTYEESIPVGPNIWQIPGMPFFIEQRSDGNMGIHLDRGNYLVMKKGEAPEVYYNNNKGQGGSKRLF
ncbi:N-acetylmuramoyl-L-alanine amidase [Clostridium sp. WILCCON 0269]|uniref:N-acetylmuramoyl-L-alanine amidase n=1 Tax=Candidatus Clostridium eludens TaxID=3381663 RepID=A0ABW8SLY6_9CLOT